MAGYVAILEAPPIPAASVSLEEAVVSAQQLAFSTQPSKARVDQDELIVSDIVPPVPLSAHDAALASQTSKVDQDERILSDIADESSKAESS
jgi:hypothetical protein